MRMKTGKMTMLVALLAIMLLIQACGSGNGGTAAPTANEGEKTATNQPQAAAEADGELNIGFVGASEFPPGAEGWGLYTGIIQEELKKQGIGTINVTGLGTGPDLNEAVISGRIDLGTSGDAPSILARAAGAKTKVIAQPLIQNNSFLIGKKGGVATAKELDGKKIAVVKGSQTHRYLVGLLQKLDIKAEVLDMRGSEALPALARGDIDALAGVSYVLENYLLVHKEGYPLLGEASEYPDLYGTTSTYVSEAFLEKYPDFPKAWAEARAKAYNDLVAKPDEYYSFLAKNLGADREIVDKLYPIEDIQETALSDDGIERLRKAKEFLVNEGLAELDFNFDEWIVR